MDFITVRIRNFAKYKGRKDVTHNSWFRCSNRLLEDPELYNLSHSEMVVWIYFLSLSSQKNSAEIRVFFEHANRVAKISKELLLTAVEKLNEIKIIEVDQSALDRARNVDDTQTCATNKQTNITNTTLHNTTNKQTNKGDEKPKKLRSLKAPAPEGTQDAIAFYCEQWKLRYQGDSPIRGKESGIIKQLVKDLGLEKTLAYIAAYFQMPDSWYITKRHDLPTLTANLPAVASFIATGKVITRQDVKAIESAVDNHNLRNLVNQGKV